MPWSGPERRRHAVNEDVRHVLRALYAINATLDRMGLAVERLAAASVATLPPELAAALAAQAVEAAKLQREVQENQPPPSPQ